MIDSTFVKNIISGVLKNRHTAALDKNIMHPKREWFAAIFIGLLFLFCASVWSYMTYHQFSNVRAEEPGEALEAVVYRESLVNTALFDFANRKKGYEELKAELLSKNLQAPKPPVVEVVVPAEVPIEEGASNGVPDSIQFQ